MHAHSHTCRGTNRVRASCRPPSPARSDTQARAPGGRQARPPSFTNGLCTRRSRATRHSLRGQMKPGADALSRRGGRDRRGGATGPSHAARAPGPGSRSPASQHGHPHPPGREPRRPAAAAGVASGGSGQRAGAGRAGPSGGLSPGPGHSLIGFRARAVHAPGRGFGEHPGAGPARTPPGLSGAWPGRPTAHKGARDARERPACAAGPAATPRSQDATGGKQKPCLSKGFFSLFS